MNDDPQAQSQQHWFFHKWPDWLKIFAAIGTIGGGLSAIFGAGGFVISAVKNHDSAVKAKVLADQAVIERNNDIDQTLKYHGQQISTLDTKIDSIDKKVTRIEKAVAPPDKK